MPKLLQELLPDQSQLQDFKADLNKLVTQALQPESVQEQLKRDKKIFDLYKQAWTQKVIEEDDTRVVTIFVLEKFMQRLGFIGSQRYPLVSESTSKDTFCSYYSGYDLLFVVTFLYLGLCQEKSIHLPQVRNDRPAPKMKTNTSSSSSSSISSNNEVNINMMEIREEASSAHIDLNGIRRIWNATEPIVLSSYLKYEKFIVSALEDHNPSVQAFLKSREEYFKVTKGCKSNTTLDKENVQATSKSISKIAKLRDRLKARLQGEVLDIDDSESEDDGWI